MWNPESTAWNPESKTVGLPYMGRKVCRTGCGFVRSLAVFSRQMSFALVNIPDHDSDLFADLVKRLKSDHL